MRTQQAAVSLALRKTLHTRLRSGMGRHEHLEIDAREQGVYLYEDGRLESLVAPGKVMASQRDEIEEEPYE